MKTRPFARIVSQPITAAVAALGIFLSVPHVRGADAEKAAAAIERGLTFLAGHQREDGSVGVADAQNSVGVTSLAGLAWIGSGAHAENVAGVAKFIVSRQREDGFIIAAAPRGGSMYDHGFATLFLATHSKAGTQPALKKPLENAVALIAKCQNADGAWRYQPVPSDGDVSVTSCQLMALVAAKNAGAEVPGAAIEKAVGYLKRCQNADGGFRYLAAEGASGFPRSAAALAASLAARELVPPAIQPDATTATAYVLGFLPDGTKQQAGGGFFMHGHYYAGQALRHRGGEAFARWREAASDALLATQKEDGAWANQVSPEFGTSEACLILQTAKAGR
jgi:prenyltransferase beta subunit